MLLFVPDSGGLEICCYGDRQASVIHLLPSDDCRNYRNPHGRAAYIRVCGPGSNNRDLSRKVKTRRVEFLWTELFFFNIKPYGTLFFPPAEEWCVENVLENVTI